MKILSENFSKLSTLETQIKSYFRTISSSSSIDSTTDAGDGPTQCIDGNLQLLVKQMKRYIRNTRSSLDKLSRCQNQTNLHLYLEKYNQVLNDLDTFLQSINNVKPITKTNEADASNQLLIRPLSPKVIIINKSRVEGETYLSTLTSSQSESESQSESSENLKTKEDSNLSISSSSEALIYHNEIQVKSQSRQSTIDLSYQMPFEAYQGDSIIHQLIRLTQILVTNKRFLFLTVGLLMTLLLFIQLEG